MVPERDKQIDGKMLAEEILDSLIPRVVALKKKNVIPTLAVIQVDQYRDSNSYIQNKKATANRIGVNVIVNQYPKSVFFQELAETIHKHNINPRIHGIIIQRPLPSMLSTSSFNKAVDLKKDVDGFRLKSTFRSPIALAIFHILRHIYQLKKVTTHLKNKQIVLIGRGETAGKPIAELLSEKKIPFLQCHSQTTNIKEFTEEADIIISCVGKPNIITSDIIKKGVVLIGIGIYRSENNKLFGDYDVNNIKDKASFYTPTPGGTGPLNIAYLLSNLVTATEKVA